MQESVIQCDVLIVGNGMAGLALACALGQQTDLNIMVLAPDREQQRVDQHSQYQPRVSALSLASRQILKDLDVWQSIDAVRTGSFKQIYVWDAAQQADIHFDAHDIAASRLGYIVENQLIQQSLQDKAKSCANIEFLTEKLETLFDQGERGYLCQTANGDRIQSRLVVGADGATSTVRELVGIQSHIKDYQQQAIVSHVTTEMPHQLVAQQVFLSTGPLAFLPLQPAHLSSIVWSLPDADAQAMLALDDEAFKVALETAFSSRLGKVVDVMSRVAFPLRQLSVDQYVKPNLALIGDAAHVVHPLAGQGVNIGLLDAASLAELIADAVNRQRNFASWPNLRRYERWRKADNQGLLFGIDWIKQLFDKQQTSAVQLRRLGLNAVNGLPLVKQKMIHHAVGYRDMLPRLATGDGSV